MRGLRQFSTRRFRITTTYLSNMENNTVELSVTQYAAARGVSRQRILARIRDKALPKGITSKKTGNQWVLTMTPEQAEPVNKKI